MSRLSDTSLADAAIDCLRAPSKTPTSASGALRSGGGRGGLFSSDLSVDEALLVHEAGFEPRGLVMGSSIYHVGYQWTMGMGNAEVTNLSQAMYSARASSMNRLMGDCAKVGGHGVVGVRLTVEMVENNMMEFVSIGTAIAAVEPARAKDLSKRPRPFTSDLSGRDFYLLNRAGYEPLELVMGSCVYHMSPQGLGQMTSGQNGEISSFTQAMYEARELAMERMQKEAASTRALGVVGVSLKERSHAWGSRAIEFFAVGTAVRLLGAEHQLVEPTLAVSLEDLNVDTDPGAITGD